MPTGKANDTSDQRRVVIIIVLEREDGTNVDEALRSAMALEEHQRADLRGAVDTLLAVGSQSLYVGGVGHV